MPKEIIFRSDIHRKMLSGVHQLADTVKATLGPVGRSVVLHRTPAAPVFASDGAAIISDFSLEDPFENMGVQIIKDIAQRGKALSGDGMTTAVVLAQRMIQEGERCLAAGADPLELKKGMQGAAQLTAAAVQRLARPVRSSNTIAQVASVASGDPAVGSLVAEALDRVGPNGIVTVDETGSRDTVLQVMEGMQFERGYLSPHMVTDEERMVAELDHPYILITDETISQIHTLAPVLEQVAASGRPLLIIAENVTGDALAALTLNKLRGTLTAAAVQPPAYGEGRRARLEDLAIYTGAALLSRELGRSLENVTLDMLGSAESVRIERHSTAVINGGGSPLQIAERIQMLQAMIGKTDQEFNQNALKERLASLAGGAAVIHVGGVTETEIKAAKLRTENALHAARAAMAEGVVPGGGTALIGTLPAVSAYAASLEGDRRTGASIVAKSLCQPLYQIARNAGFDGSTIVSSVQATPGGVGFDAQTGTLRNMEDAGILDAARAIRLALLGAVSAAAMLLTAEAGIADGGISEQL